MTFHITKRKIDNFNSRHARSLRCFCVGLMLMASMSGCSQRSLDAVTQVTGKLIQQQTGISSSVWNPLLKDMSQYLVSGPLAQILAPDDLDRANQATTQALNGGRKGSTVSWKNPDDPSTQGSATVNNVYTQNGGECMSVDETGMSHGKEIKQTSTYCRNPGDSEWKLAS
ncbi:MAG: hypothetical protein ACXWT1_04120 [Methylobacter sp.]